MAEIEKKSPKVEIIILNYKRVMDTIALLESLRNLDYANYSVIIIENGSPDNSAESLKPIAESYPGWNFVFNENNLGFSGGCNQGIEIALKGNADFVLLLNNDTEVEKDFLAPLVELSQKNNSLAGGLIHYEVRSEKRIWSYGGNLTFGAVPGHLGFINKKSLPNSFPKENNTDWIPGCCLLIPRKVIEKIGLLDEDYFAYIEDVDYCVRASKAGFSSFVTSESVIFHKVGQATGGGYSAGGRFLIGESSVIFIRKHGSWSNRIKFMFMFWLGILVAFIREGAKGNISSVSGKIKGYRSGWLKKLTEPRRIRHRSYMD